MNNINLIYGAPGCGKTTYLLNILEDELKIHSPKKIAFVSFTKKGTYEGRDRVIKRFNYSKNDLLYFRTLHSIAFREGHFSIYNMISKKDYKLFSTAMDMHFTGYYTEEFYNNDDRYLFMDFLIRNNRDTALKYIDLIDRRLLNNIRYNYKEYKKEMGLFDFTDIISLFIENDKSLPIDIAIIDEAQDLTTLQWKMCEIAFREAKKVYIAGDDDQAIYEWNGADVNYFLKLKGKRTILRKTYRLQKNILNFSKNIVKHIHNRVEKDINALTNKGNVYFYNSIDEIKIDKDKTYYFLARNNYFLKDYASFLKNKGEIFYEKNKLSVNLNHIKAINNYEKMRKLKNDFKKDTLKLYLKRKDINFQIPWYNAFNFNEEDIIYYKDIIKNKTKIENVKITVSTIHGVKGGEADEVVMRLDITKAVKESIETNPNSEYRCLYVAFTRAKQNLHIIFSSTKNGYDTYLNFKELNNE